MANGRRQIGAFLLPGDIFGWEALGEHDFGVDAVTPVTLRRVPSSVIEQRADSDPAFAQQLRQYGAAQVRATRGRLVLLGRKTAAERVASFLLEMDDRLPAPETSVLRLPMSRGDVADYLGLTVETVCRGLAELRQRGIITVERAHITILDRRALRLAAADRPY
jgi:CRP-like cAMP-binding protein